MGIPGLTPLAPDEVAYSTPNAAAKGRVSLVEEGRGGQPVCVGVPGGTVNVGRPATSLQLLVETIVGGQQP
jgi:hypothetical protein